MYSIYTFRNDFWVHVMKHFHKMVARWSTMVHSRTLWTWLAWQWHYQFILLMLYVQCSCKTDGGRYFVQWRHNNYYRATKSPPCIHAVCFLSVILWAYLFPSFLKDGQSAAEWPSNAYSSECLWLWHGGVTRQDVARHASVCACAWRLAVTRMAN